MRNRDRRRRGSDEINLTPLLDVLFTILFIVMLTGTQNEQTMLENAEAAQAQLEGLQAQETSLEGRISDLEEENGILKSEVSRHDKIQDSTKRYESEAVVVTFWNEEEDGYHVLRIHTEPDGSEESFRLGLDRAEYTKSHVTEIINGIVEGAVDHPVFIVFHCDAGIIYRKEEFNPIRDALEMQKKNRKEVFYQIVEE